MKVHQLLGMLRESPLNNDVVVVTHDKNCIEPCALNTKPGLTILECRKQGPSVFQRHAIIRLTKLAEEAVTDYNVQMAHGGEPTYPQWAKDVIDMLSVHL
jgi:hypothetical protein